MRFQPININQISVQERVLLALKDLRFGVRHLKRFMMDSTFTLPPDILDQAARHGNLPVLRWITKEHPTMRCTNKALDWAAEFGFLDGVTFLHLRRREFNLLLTMHPDCTHRFGGTKDAMTMALINGYYEIYYFFHLHRTEMCYEWTVDEMIRSHGDLEMIEIVTIERNEVEISECTLMAAIDTDSLEIVTWLFMNHREDILKNASFDALQYAEKHKNPEIINYISFALSNL